MSAVVANVIFCDINCTCNLQVLINDFFLVACLDDFIENARLFIFETFCRIHQCISIRYM